MTIPRGSHSQVGRTGKLFEALHGPAVGQHPVGAASDVDAHHRARDRIRGPYSLAAEMTKSRERYGTCVDWPDGNDATTLCEKSDPTFHLYGTFSVGLRNKCNLSTET